MRDGQSDRSTVSASDFWICFDLGLNFNWGPLGRHHLGGDPCPPTTLEGLPIEIHGQLFSFADIGRFSSACKPQ